MGNDGAAGGTEALQAFMNGSFGKAIGLGSEELSLGLEIAKAHISRGALAEALKIYACLVLCEPTNVDFQIGLANCTLHMEEYHIALQAASVVVALAPRNPRGYYLSGRACLGLGHLAEAAEDFGDAIAFGKQARDALVVEEARKLLSVLPEPAPAPSRPMMA